MLPPSRSRCPGRFGGPSGEISFTGTVVSFPELLRAALNDPGSVRTSQVSQDVGWGIPWDEPIQDGAPGLTEHPKSSCSGADHALLSRRWCSMSWATSSALPWLCSSPWLCRWPGCASATAGAAGGAGDACAPTGARWAAAATACWPACPSPPLSSCESPKHPMNCPPRPGRGNRVPWGWDGSAGQPRHRLLVPGRTSIICAFVTSQRVKGQMEPGLGAVPATLRTLRQHIANIPQVGPQAASPSAGCSPGMAAFPSESSLGGEKVAAALKMYFEWQHGASSPPGRCSWLTSSSLLAGGADGGRPV